MKIPTSTTAFDRVQIAYTANGMDDNLRNIAASSQHLGLRAKVDALVSDIQHCYLAKITPSSEQQKSLVPVLKDMRASCLSTRLVFLAKYASAVKEAQPQIRHGKLTAAQKLERQAQKDALHSLTSMAKQVVAARAPQDTGIQSPETKKASATELPLRFGQLRAAPQFQSDSGDKGKLEIEVPNRPITTVAEELKTDDYSMTLAHTSEGATNRLSTIMPIEVFPHFDTLDDESGVAVVINNRGMAAHALAQTRPVRLLPRLPTEGEAKRLHESEPATMSFRRIKRNSEDVQLDKQHKVPSSKIPLTRESKGNVSVQTVAQIPGEWSIKLSLD